MKYAYQQIDFVLLPCVTKRTDQSPTVNKNRQLNYRHLVVRYLASQQEFEIAYAPSNFRIFNSRIYLPLLQQFSLRASSY